MRRKYQILLGLLFSILLLIIATLIYPGGSQANTKSIGFDWSNNYLCNLFDQNAMNGLSNAARPWAIAGMFGVCVSFTFFFVEFSKMIPERKASRMIKYFGTGSMLFAILIVTSYHDIILTLASILGSVAIIYMIIAIFRSNMPALKMLSIACLILSLICNYIYYTRSHLEMLPVMQKVAMGFIIFWISSIMFFTDKEDFKQKTTTKYPQAPVTLP